MQTEEALLRDREIDSYTALEELRVLLIKNGSDPNILGADEEQVRDAINAADEELRTNNSLSQETIEILDELYRPYED